jgi:hypothetical protein
MTSQYGAHAVHAGKARLHEGTHTHAQTPVSSTHCFSTATVIHEEASRLRYTYIISLVCLCTKSWVTIGYTDSEQ